MNTILRSASLLALPALSAFASANLDFASSNFVLTRPASGTATYQLSGTLSLAPSQVSGTRYSSLVAPTNGLGSSLQVSINPDFVAAFSAAPSGISYSGPIVDVTLSSTDLLGVYGSDPSGAPDFGRNGGEVQYLYTGLPGSGFFKVTVAPVPEPATMAALGLGAVAMLRRRKRS